MPYALHNLLYLSTTQWSGYLFKKIILQVKKQTHKVSPKSHWEDQDLKTSIRT